MKPPEEITEKKTPEQIAEEWAKSAIDDHWEPRITAEINGTAPVFQMTTVQDCYSHGFLAGRAHFIKNELRGLLEKAQERDGWGEDNLHMKITVEKTPKQWSTAQAPTLEALLCTARGLRAQSENESLRKRIAELEAKVAEQDEKLLGADHRQRLTDHYGEGAYMPRMVEKATAKFNAGKRLSDDEIVMLMTQIKWLESQLHKEVQQLEAYATAQQLQARGFEVLD